MLSNPGYLKLAGYVIRCMKRLERGILFYCKLASLSRLLFPVVLIFGFQQLKAQNIHTDTLRIIEKIVEKQDTMTRNPFQEPASRKWTLLQDEPIDSLLYRENGTRFRRELLNLLIKSGGGGLSNKKAPTTNSNLAAMDGRIIRRIDFKKVDIFSPSVADTDFIPSSWFESTVNALHNDTRRSVLMRYLLLKSGEPLDVFLAAENERILRDLSFIMDARFVARQIPGSPDSVDILLLTQDLMPIGAEAELVKSSLATVGISNQNVLGFGHQFKATSYWNSEKKPLFGYSLSYGSSNLVGTFLAGRFEYTHKWNQESYYVDITRDFRTPSFRNAGGLIFENTEIIKGIELLDTNLYDVSLDYTNTDFWYGRMFRIKTNSASISSGFFLNGRFNQYKNNAVPIVTDDYLFNFQDRTLLLFSTGFTRQSFRKDNLIYTFGRTEDVPSGFLFEITPGVEWGQKDIRTYLSAGAAFGRYFRNARYLSGQVKFGTYLNNGSMEQGAFRAQLRYFSRLHQNNRFKQRNFVNITYIHGINRFAGEFTGLENRGGVEGLTGQSMRGNDKLVLNVESVIFSPFIFLGFRFAFFGSLDLGLVGQENAKIVDSRLFSGLSAGVRIRNDQLVFNTFVIKFAIYPGKPGDSIAQNFIMDSMPRLRLDYYFPQKPAIINFQ